jgi:hypothetical protein
MYGDRIKKLLAEERSTEQEPVAWLCTPNEDGLFGLPLSDKGCKDCFPVYRHPPHRPWVGLTDEEKKSFWTADQMTQEEWDELFNAIEAKLKEKNTPQRTWVDLSDEDIEECFTITPDLYLKRHIAQRILDKFKEKNNG